MKHSLKAVLILAALAGGVAQATTFTWQPTTGGDLADGANWNQSGVAPGGSTSDLIEIKKDQSAPLTLSSDINLKDQYGNLFSFSGEFAFGSLSRTLRTARTFQKGTYKTLKLTSGTLYLGTLYQEDGNTGSYNDTFVVDGPEAKLQATVYVGSKHRNDKVIVTNGATVAAGDISVGRDALLNSNGAVASNNLFRATGAGTTVTLTDTLSTGIRQDNRIEILDHAVVSANHVKLGVSNYDNADTTAGGARHIYDSGKRLLVTGGAKLICNPSGSTQNARLTVGWQTGSNVVEVADGGELICYTNKVLVGNYWSSSEGTTKMTDYDPNYRFAGNRLRVTGKDSKVRIYGASQTGVFIGIGACMDDQRIEILDGASWYSSGEFWLSSGCGNGVYLGKNARFVHDIYTMQLGINAAATNFFFIVDGGTYAPNVATMLGGGGHRGRFEVINGGVAAITNQTVTVGQNGSDNWMTVANGGRMMTSNAILTVTSGTGGGNVFAVTNGGKAFFNLSGNSTRKHYLCSGKDSQGATLLVDGKDSLVDMTGDQIMAITTGGGTARGARLVVTDGGTVKFGSSYFGDQGNGIVDCGVLVSNGVMDVGTSLNIGGSDSTLAHGCWMSVQGAKTDVSLGGTLAIMRDSTLSFAVPKNGFEATPVKAKTLSFGTQCATRPTLKVTADPLNQVRFVEAENDITVPADLNLDLPAGAKLLQAGDNRYDAKKLIVKLPTNSGLLLLFR